MSVKKNFSYLFSIHILNFIVPLLSIPYLARVLDTDVFGLFFLCQSTIVIFSVFIDFGFGFTATADVAKSTSDIYKVKEVVNRVFCTKLVIFFACVSFLCLFSLFFSINDEFFLLLVAIFSLLGYVFTPNWYFQGKQKLGRFAAIVALSKFAMLAGYFIFVTEKDDIVLALMCYAISIIIPAIGGLVIMYRWGEFSLKFITFFQLKSEFFKGFPLFLSGLSTSLYSNINGLVLAQFAGLNVVAQYSTAERVKAASLGLYGPIRQAVFPRIIEMSSAPGWIPKMLKLFGVPLLLLSLVASLSMYFFGEYVVSAYLGAEFSRAGFLFKCMFPLPIIVALSTIFSHWALIVLEKRILISKIYSFGAMLHIIFLYVFVMWFHDIGIVVAVVLTELNIATLLGISFFREYKLVRMYE